MQSKKSQTEWRWVEADELQLQVAPSSVSLAASTLATTMPPVDRLHRAGAT